MYCKNCGARLEGEGKTCEACGFTRGNGLSYCPACGKKTEKAPLGEGINDALETFLAIGKRFGFKTKNLDGYAGCIEAGGGDKLVGIITHTDTVKAGDNWTYPPFKCTVSKNGVYGRGVTDDKGPALLSLYAMREAEKNGFLKDKRVRLIIGGDEESGIWRCIKRYKETETMPDIAFSPDAEYPVVFGEKGLLKVRIFGIEKAIAPDFRFEGGSVINIVPDKACAFIDGKEMQETGKAAHGSLPEKGENAIIKLSEKISALYPDSTFSKLCSLKDAKSLKIDLKDEYTSLSINPAIIRADSHECSLSYDIRYPITADGEKVIKSIKSAAEEKGLLVEILSHDAPLYVPLDSHLITTLSSVYKEITDDGSLPVAIGGGTYAKAFSNCAAFGVMLPDDPDTMHAPDEFWSFNSINTNFDIILKAIERL